MRIRRNTYAEKLANRLPHVFDEAEFDAVFDELLKESAVSEGARYRLFKRLHKIPIEWNKAAVRQLYSYSKAFEIEDLLSAWTRSKFYLSHFSALYWNELVEQRPVEHFLSTEVKSHVVEPAQHIDPVVMRQVFMKEARTTSRFGTLKEYRFTFIEKPNLSEIGVAEKFGESENQKIRLRVTDIERTLLDCVVAPHYSGGLVTVIAAFGRAQFDIDKLYKYYMAQNFSYPYWQSIGLILSVVSEEKSSSWKKMFSAPKDIFYLDRKYRSDWKLSEDWKVFYPPGMVSYGNR